VTLLSSSGRPTRKFLLGLRLWYTSPRLEPPVSVAVAVVDVLVVVHVMSDLQAGEEDMVVVGMEEVVVAVEEDRVMAVVLPTEEVTEEVVVDIQAHHLLVANPGGKAPTLQPMLPIPLSSPPFSSAPFDVNPCAHNSRISRITFPIIDNTISPAPPDSFPI